MPAKIYSEPMKRKNMHLPTKQIARMEKLAEMENTSCASLYREAADKLILERVEKMKAEKPKATA